MRLLSSLSGVEGPDVLAFLYTKKEEWKRQRMRFY